MELPSRGVPDLRGLAQSCLELLGGRGAVIFSARDRAAPSPQVQVRGAAGFVRIWPGDFWEAVAVPTLDSFQAGWTSPVPTPITVPTFDQVYARVVYYYQATL